MTVGRIGLHLRPIIHRHRRLKISTLPFPSSPPSPSLSLSSLVVRTEEDDDMVDRASAKASSA